MKTKKINAATLWIVTDKALAMGATCEHAREYLLDVFERGGSKLGRVLNSEDALSYLNPIEMTIRLTDVQKAIDKWTARGIAAERLIVVREHKPGYDRFNEVYV